MKFINANCEKIAVENPVGIMTSYYRRATQYIHPYQFGHPAAKTTGLWLKGLPELKPTNIVEVEYITNGKGKKEERWFYETGRTKPVSNRAKVRSKTFEGIAEAMADQWGTEN